ncbi:hypothetical protein CNMCM5793_003000 [Aspergillus hiratsukae]|uniref:Uncharacterized protein n=1 Tax=Aspergillus hiratsukae TaxID=1194566 RepID=A0A8H6UJG5_9EURO|nr:hypothetical protein CNMCM5793_003000 [Aspergillus hiratsukae]KAF7155290.1 hypothetical protein CNMCM6106_002745 [Aspergillus hiratsukae]
MNENISQLLTATSHPIILTERNNWPAWYKGVQLASMCKNVWPYVDPDSKDPPAVPDEPALPAYRDFQIGARRYSDLDEKNRVEYDHALQMYRWVRDDVRRIRGDLAYIALVIATSVSKYAHSFIVDENDPREMLRLLQGPFEPGF